MKINFKWLALLALMGAGWFFYWGILPGPRSPLTGYDKTMQLRYDQLALDILAKDVVTKLGQPCDTNITYCLPQYFEPDIGKASNQSARVFYLWRNGINWYYCIGFDGEDRLIVKGQGHS
jgi:hypothetical protein